MAILINSLKVIKVYHQHFPSVRPSIHRLSARKLRFHGFILFSATVLLIKVIHSNYYFRGVLLKNTVVVGYSYFLNLKKLLESSHDTKTSDWLNLYVLLYYRVKLKLYCGGFLYKYSSFVLLELKA